MRRRLPLLLLLGLTTTAGMARADVLPDGEKGVRLSIAVEAAVPEGKALILANTFRGADVLKPGEVAKVEWHPLGGEMQIKLIDAADVPAILTAREALDRDTIRPMAERGKACAPPFPGVRTVPETEPYDEIRWHYRVAFSGSGCTAELLRTEQLAAAKDPDEPPPPPAEPLPEAPEPPAAPPPAAAATPPAAPPAKASGGCGCSTGENPGAGLLGLALLGLVGGRRRRGTSAGARRRP